MHRGKVDPGVSELPRGNELSRDHVNRPLLEDDAMDLSHRTKNWCMMVEFRPFISTDTP